MASFEAALMIILLRLEQKIVYFPPIKQFPLLSLRWWPDVVLGCFQFLADLNFVQFEAEITKTGLLIYSAVNAVSSREVLAKEEQTGREAI